MEQIKTLHGQIVTSIMTINPVFDYSDLASKFIDLAKLVNEYCNNEDDTESLWYIGDVTGYTLDTLIVGAYWHYTHWHGGQDSTEYAALCMLGKVYTPNMESEPTEGDNEWDIYHQLNQMAEKEFAERT